MKEVHELSLDLYEAKIGTYVRDIIPVEETNEIVRSERGGIPFPKPFSKWKSQNPNAEFKNLSLKIMNLRLHPWTKILF